MKSIPSEGISNDALIAAVGQDLYKIGFRDWMKSKGVKKVKASGLIAPLVSEPEDSLQVAFYTAPHR